MSGSAWASNEATPIRRSSDISDGSSSSLPVPARDQPGSSLSEAMALDAALQHWSRSQTHDAGAGQGYAALGTEGTSSMALQAEAARRWQQQQQYQQQQYQQQRYLQQQHGYHQQAQQQQQQQQQQPPRHRPRHHHPQPQPQPHSHQNHLLTPSSADIYLQQAALLSHMHSGDDVASAISQPAPSNTTALLPATTLGYPAAMSQEQGMPYPSLFFSLDSSAGANTPHPSSLPVRDARRASAPTSLDVGQPLGSTLFSAAPSASTARETPPWNTSTTPLQPPSPSSSALVPSQADSSTSYPSQASSHSLPVMLSSLPATGSFSLDTRLTSPATSSPYSPFGKAASRSLSANMASKPSSPPTSLASYADSYSGHREGEASGTFRARELDSKESAPACDFCRKRKVKCDRVQPTCSFCTKHGIRCTTEDRLRKRGPPTKVQRMEMKHAGFVYDRSKRRWRSQRQHGDVSNEEDDEQQQQVGAQASSEQWLPYAGPSVLAQTAKPTMARSSHGRRGSVFEYASNAHLLACSGQDGAEYDD